MKFKGITIRKLSLKDIQKAKKFKDFDDLLIEEDLKIRRDKKISLKEGVDRLKNNLKDIKKKNLVFLMAEHDNKIVGTISIKLEKGKQKHVGGLGITIAKDYRGIGLGNYLMTEIIKLAKKNLKPKMIKLSVYVTNKPAVRLYEKQGFKKVAVIPKQFKHKGRFIDEVVMVLEL